MRQLTLAVLMLLFSGAAFAGDLQSGQTYALHITVMDLKKPDGSGSFTAARPSKFVVLDDSDPDNYLVRFVTVYSLTTSTLRAAEGETSVSSTVRKDEAYYLPKKYNGAETSLLTTSAYSGPVSGPLVVPFKFRFGDDSIAGEAAIGYYAGYSWSMPVGFGNRIPFTPFLAGGLSQVSVDTASGSEDKSAFTWAAGLLIQNWSKVNVGLVYGQDRTGDKGWEHEGDGWLSFMVGWVIE